VGFLLTSIKAVPQLRHDSRALANNLQSPLMSTSIRFIALFAAILAASSAEAQYLLGLETNIELTKQDLAIIHHTVTADVHGKPVGTTARWSNPESGNSGKIALVNKFMRNGQQCETLDYRLTTRRKAAGPEHYQLSSCLQSDGQWRLI
jgi:surface antigen